MISIIVPVYNAELYLRECVTSILAQTFCHFEVVLVDDGSKDSSGAICEELAETDGRIRMIHQVNAGVTRARAEGVKMARGEWITFVDADDTLPKDALESLMSATGNDTDIVIGRIDDRKMAKTLSLEEYRKCCIAGRKVHSGPFARAFRARLFTDKTFDIPREIFRGEDLIMNVRLAFATAKAPILIERKVYNYRTNDSSVMHTFKESLAHMELFQKCLQRSVPEEYIGVYTNELLISRMRSLVTYATDNVGDFSYKETSYYKLLISDMKRRGMHFNFEQKLKLSARTPFQLRMAYRLLHLIDILSCVK